MYIISYLGNYAISVGTRHNIAHCIGFGQWRRHVALKIMDTDEINKTS